MKVLVAEDDAHIREGLVEILEAEGYRTSIAADGRAALSQYEAVRPDFVLLDIMMPHQNGYDVCREIRRRDPDTPIIFISAKSEEIDRVVGLELGADDFIQKPFGVKEVIARIRAVTRRCMRRPRATPVPEAFTMADLVVMPAELRARRGDETLDLSLRDVQILTLLRRNVGKVVDREAFFRECWGLDHLPNSRTLDQHISKLRKRIERDPREPQIIRTVHGVGYRYEQE
ncbi:MAG: response regulator transcription factor [Myxococcales bacterium]|nr:response regulator transcription factor [Myxococcales bacterium]